MNTQLNLPPWMNSPRIVDVPHSPMAFRNYDGEGPIEPLPALNTGEFGQGEAGYQLLSRNTETDVVSAREFFGGPLLDVRRRAFAATEEMMIEADLYSEICLYLVQREKDQPGAPLTYITRVFANEIAYFDGMILSFRHRPEDCYCQLALLSFRQFVEDLDREFDFYVKKDHNTGFGLFRIDINADFGEYHSLLPLEATVLFDAFPLLYATAGLYNCNMRKEDDPWVVIEGTHCWLYDVARLAVNA